MAVFSALSPEPPTPDSPYVTLIIPLGESKVSVYKQNLVQCLFKGVPVFLAISPCQTERLVLFTGRCYVGTFSSSFTLAWGAQLGV